MLKRTILFISCLLFRAGGRHQDFPVAVRLHRRDDTAIFHLFKQTRRTVVADAQMALHQRDRGAPILQHYLHHLIVHRVGLAAASPGAAPPSAPPSPSSVPPSRMPSM